MPVQQVNLAALSGTGQPIALRSDQETADLSFALRASIEVGGIAVSSAAPVPVAATPLASVFSVALESSHVLKAAPGTLYGFQANATQTGWFLLFDAAGVPADGVVIPRKAWQFNSAVPGTLDIHCNPPLAFTSGITLVFSTTGPFTKTAAASAQFSGEIA